jgi:hypothetical protein
VVVRDERKPAAEQSASHALSHRAKPDKSDRGMLRNRCPDMLVNHRLSANFGFHIHEA